MSNESSVELSDDIFTKALKADTPAPQANNLPAYLAATAFLTCPDKVFPTVTYVGFGGKWIAVVYSDGRTGRAFAFNEAHAVYGDIPASVIDALADIVGMPADEAIVCVLGKAVQATDDSERMFYRSCALALGNALASRMNHPDALQERGFEVKDSSDLSFLLPNDHVVLIGAGMLIDEASRLCRSVDVIDMRPVSALQTIVFSAQGCETGPRRVHFHGPGKTTELLSQADVVGITGCAFANGTVFDLLPLAKNARERVLFGPSAQLPMELIANLGVTHVLTSCEEDGEKLLARLKAPYERGVGNDGMCSYLVSLPQNGIE